MHTQLQCRKADHKQIGTGWSKAKRNLLLTGYLLVAYRLLTGYLLIGYLLLATSS